MESFRLVKIKNTRYGRYADLIEFMIKKYPHQDICQEPEVIEMISLDISHSVRDFNVQEYRLLLSELLELDSNGIMTYNDCIRYIDKKLQDKEDEHAKRKKNVTEIYVQKTFSMTIEELAKALEYEPERVC